MGGYIELILTADLWERSGLGRLSILRSPAVAGRRTGAIVRLNRTTAENGAPA